MEIKERLNLVRKWLKKGGYSAIVIPTNDPHFSEYVADYWKTREWVSGFTGSAGTVVVTAKDAMVWCDSRYYVQAELELKDTPYTAIQKIGMPNTPTINGWLAKNIAKGGKVAIDGKLFGINSYRDMCAELPNIEVAIVGDPFDEVWSDRPSLPQTMVRVLDESATGETVISKVERLQEAVCLGDSIYITSALDEIAWLLNIRGADVNYNPVVISYLAVSKQGTTLFVDKSKFITESYNKLMTKGVTIAGYDEFDSFLASLNGKSVVANCNRFDIYHYNLLIDNGATVSNDPNSFGTITYLKSIKNRVELKGITEAMINDGASLVKFNMWLERALDRDEIITEHLISEKLNEYRMSCNKYVGESFNSIVGYGANGAIVHYSPTKESSATLKPEGFLLFDSGGQYEYGTTDITRTIHLSHPTERERHDFTLVLKGNISLSKAVFPTGTTGYQLDILARQHLLRSGLNYGHGTGHGIGHYLNVHEGPHSIRADYNPNALVAGMVTSNEPGLYRVGEYGIRLENIIKVSEHSSNEFGNFLCFETLTLFPFDLKSINVGMLTIEERHWLNRYHADVFDKLSEHLSTEERFWLSNKTKAI